MAAGGRKGQCTEQGTYSKVLGKRELIQRFLLHQLWSKVPDPPANWRAQVRSPSLAKCLTAPPGTGCGWAPSPSTFCSPPPSRFKAGSRWTSAARRICLGQSEHEVWGCQPGASKAQGLMTCSRPCRALPSCCWDDSGLCADSSWGGARGAGPRSHISHVSPSLCV